jgi:sugar lactone lactonase YvrE
MRSYTAELAHQYPATLGEGALWDERRGVLWWVDIVPGNVHCFNPTTKINETFAIGTPVGAVVLDTEGHLILAVKDGFARYNTENGVCEMLAIVPHVNESIRFNDGKCDPEGRFWAGTLAEDGPQNVGTLYCLERDFSITKKLQGVGISNGIAWSPSGDTMYYIDSVTQKVLAFQYANSTGAISHSRVVIEIPSSVGVPDGMCVDSLGMLWVALWDGGKVIQIHPVSGEILSEVVVPNVRKVTSCAFGGEDMNTLFITTARQGLTSEEERYEPHAGSLFAVPVPVSGLTTYVFHGVKK